MHYLQEGCIHVIFLRYICNMVADIDDIPGLLRTFGLSATNIRCQVVDLLWGDGVALTQRELEGKLPGNTDRVTVYRTLKLFIKEGIIHKIVLDGKTQKYKLAGRFRKSDHAHFYCIHCHKLLCMPQLNVDAGALPVGFEFYSARLVVEGICDYCSSSKK